MTWFEVWVDAGRHERIDAVYGSLGFALLVARSIACDEQVHTELSFAADIPFLEFDSRGGPLPVRPFVLPLLPLSLASSRRSGALLA